MSRQTLLSLWLALTLGVVTWGWCATHPDECARYLAGDALLPDSQEVSSGKTMVTVPCGVWLPRQRPGVQGAVAMDAILTVMFGLSFWADVRRNAERRRELGLDGR